MADDADATEARKKQRQQDEDFNEELSDEEVDLVKNLDKELGDDPEELDGIPDFDKSRSVTPVVEKDEGIEDMSDDDTQVYNIDQATIERQNMETKDAKIRKNQVLNLVPDKGNFTKNLNSNF